MERREEGITERAAHLQDIRCVLNTTDVTKNVDVKHTNTQNTSSDWNITSEIHMLGLN